MNITLYKMKEFLKKRPHFIPSLIAAVMLLVALGHRPYAYYQVLRFVVCGAAIFMIVYSSKMKRPEMVCIFGICAVLFNPIMPIHMSRESWATWDMIAAFFFMSSCGLPKYWE